MRAISSWAGSAGSTRRVFGAAPLLLLSTWLLAGCRQEVESTDVRTSGVYPEIEITADGSGAARVEVRLKVGGALSNTFLELVGEDRLTATAGGVTRTLNSTGAVAYAASFLAVSEGPFVVAFLRGPSDESAPATRVTLPGPFSMALGGAELSRATGSLTYSWTPAAGTGNLDTSLHGDCIRTVLESTPDDGAATLSGDRVSPQDDKGSDSCSATLTLTRKQNGEADPAFSEGGRVIARQVRNGRIMIRP